MSPYYLSRHIFLCPSGDQLMLLDLKNDRYMALDARQTNLLKNFLQGWSELENPEETDSTLDQHEISALARAMNEKGLVTTNEKLGKSAAPPQHCQPTTEILATALSKPTSIRLRHVLAIFYAAIASGVVVRWQSLEKVVARIAARRRRHPPGELEKTRNLVSIFFRLRPFIFRSHNRCLFDSLTLIHFLGVFGIFPQWVFGVRNDPFAAHCWIQQDNILLNDSIEHVARYSPIMIV